MSILTGKMGKMGNLEGKFALVTAGASGIGRAIADQLLDAGAAVEVCDIADEHLAEFQASHRARGDRARSVRCDVSDPDAVAAMFAARGARPLDILVNNAGIAGPTAEVDEISPAAWRETMEVNLNGQFFVASEAAGVMKRARSGSIVAIASIAGRFGYANRTPYAASKWGVIGLVKSLAQELGPFGIRANAVLPGIVAGARMESVIRNRARAQGTDEASVAREFLSRTALRRMVTANEVAATVLFLCSEAGSGISGEALSVCGGVASI